MSPSRSAGGAAPAGGTASPPVPKNVGGRCGRDSGAGQAGPSAEGQRRPQQAHPSRKRQPPIVKYELLCYDAPRKWAASPLRFFEACRRQEHWGPTVNPCGRGAQGASPAAPMAATKPALGQGAPGGCSPSPTTLRGRLGPEPSPWRGKPLGAATDPRWLAMDARWVRDGYAMHPRWLRDG